MFLEALCRVLCQCSALGWGKGSGDRSPFTRRACGLPVFGSALPNALPMLRLWCAHKARTKGRAMLRTRLSASKNGAVEDWAGKGLRESLGLSPARAPPVRQRLRSRRSRKRRDAASPSGAAAGEITEAARRRFSQGGGRTARDQALKGFTAMMPQYICPSFRSSVRMLSQPIRSAAATICAS